MMGAQFSSQIVAKLGEQAERMKQIIAATVEGFDLELEIRRHVEQIVRLELRRMIERETRELISRHRSLFEHEVNQLVKDTVRRLTL